MVDTATASLSDLPVSTGGCKIGVKSDDRRPPAAGLGRGVVKRAYEGEPGQQRADALTLDTHPFPVDQPHHGQAGRAALREIFLDHAAHLVRRKRVQVEDVLQRQHDRLGEGRVTLSSLIRRFRAARVSKRRVFRSLTVAARIHTGPPYFSSTHSPRSCSTLLRVLSPSTIHGTPPYVAIWKITSATSSLVAPTLSAALQCRRSSSWKLRAASAATAHSSRCFCESTSRAYRRPVKNRENCLASSGSNWRHRA